MRRGWGLILKRLAPEAASTTGGTVETPDSGVLVVWVNLTAVSGSSPTLLVLVEGGVDGLSWSTLGAIGANGYSSGSLGALPAKFAVPAAPVPAVFPAAQFVRYPSVIGGIAPSFTYSVGALLA
jgi:hypothetical protein